MRSVYLILLLFCSLLAHSQDEMGAIALRYPFLDTSANHFQYFGNTKGMERFYEKLDAAIFEGEGKVNVVHVGGSHVQGGTLSHTLRTELAQLAPELSVERGFFFPHRLANTNMPGNIYVKKIGNWEGCRNSLARNECPWGFSGIDAITTDPKAGFTLQSFKSAGKAYGFTELRLFEHSPSNTMVPQCSPKPDSTFLDTLAGVRRWWFNELIDSVAITFILQGSEAPQYTLQGVQMVRPESGLIYHALGVNGASTASFLRSENFVEQGRYVNPDLVIFGLGINDAYKPKSEWNPEEYKARYDTLVHWFREINPDCQFVFMTNNDSYYKKKEPNENVLDVQRVMKQLSKEYNAVYWDLFETMGGLNSIAVWEDQNLAKSDKIHFTNSGYKLNASLFFWAFWEDYENHLKTLAP